MGRGQGTSDGAQPRRARSSIDYDSEYSRPVERAPVAGAQGVTVDTYEVDGVCFSLRSGAAPFDLETGRVFEEHNVFNGGAWVGADREVPHRRVGNEAAEEIPGHVEELFSRYDRGDYGEGGEVGFAFYKVGDSTFYLIDEAVRSPEGFPPARDPETSPGPQKLLRSSEY